MPETTIDWDAKKVSWIESLDELYREIEVWATERGWEILKEETTLTEEHLGTYSVLRLTVRHPNGRLYVEPVGANILGAEGRVDLENYPTLNSLLLIRENGSWQVYTDSRVPWPNPWGPECFFNIVDALNQ